MTGTHLHLLPALGAVCALLFSCADKVPSAVGSEAITVLSYDSKNASPKIRLAVFVNVDSDARMAESIRLTMPEDKYSWTLFEPIAIMAGDGERGAWAGGTSFVMPNGEAFLTGEYRVTYTDLNGEKTECTVLVDGGQEIAKQNAAKIASMPGAQKRLAVYDKNGSLLYYGDARDEWQGANGIQALWQELDSAEEVRECFLMRGRCVLCLMPSEYKRQAASAHDAKRDDDSE